MIKVLGIQLTYLNTITVIYSKQAYIQHQIKWKLKPIPLKSRIILNSPLSPHLYNTVLEIFAREIRPLKKIRGIEIRKGSIQCTLICKSYDNRHKLPQKFLEEILQIMNTFHQVVRHKINSE